METVTDWIRLWQELVDAQLSIQAQNAPAHAALDTERGKAAASHLSKHRHWAKPDSTRDHIMAQLDATPGSTLLDIGAGSGKWAILFARHARTVTALDSSPEMVLAMKENLEAENITNVQVIQGAWPGIEVEPHDFTFCSHGMYGSRDLPAFVQRMVQSTRRTCFMILRAPTPDGVMAEAALHLWGHPYDSPNYQVALNALMQMGIFPNVLMADSGLWSPWKSASLGDALTEIKRRFGLTQNGAHDAFFTELLKQRLTWQDGQYVWPPSVRSVMVYWDARQ